MIWLLGTILFAATATATPVAPAPSSATMPEPPSLISAPPGERELPPGPATIPALIPLMKSGRLSAGDLDRLQHLGAREIGALLAAPTIRTDPCLEPDNLYHPPAPDSLDVLHYDIHFHHIHEPSQTVEATTTIRLRPLRPLTAVDLHLGGVQVTSVDVRRVPEPDFVATDYMLEGSDFHVGPFAATRPGDVLEIRVGYTGSDPSCISLYGIPSGILFSRFGLHTFGEPSGARHWFPCHDVPWDKATAKLTIDVEGDRGVSATGVLVEDTEVGSKRRRSWVVEEPAATYLLAFYLGDFVKFEDVAPNGIPLEYFVYPDLVEKARTDFSTMPEIMQFYSRFHPYPFARYAMTLGFFPGGMEHQTNSLIGWVTIRGTRANEDLFAHELAHQWWGNMITPSTWRDIWLNEGFATYFDLLFAEHKYGWPVLHRRLTVLDSVYKSHQELDHLLGDPPAKRVLSFVVYNKGAHLLHMLRGISRMRLMSGPPAPPESFTAAALEGDRRFFEIFSRYANEHAYGNASSAHFQAAAEVVLGEDLNWFFHPWLYELGYLHLEYDWRSMPVPGGVAMDVRLRRDPAGAAYRMPIHIRYVSGDRILDEVRFLDGPSLGWSVDLPPGDWSVVVDPDEWLLMDARREPLIPALTALSVAPNPSSGGFTFAAELGGSETVSGRLVVHDIQGRLIEDRDLGLVQPGPVEAEWDGRARGRRVPAGVYLARLELGPLKAVRRLVVLPGN